MNKRKESVLFERRLIHLLAKWVVERLSFHCSIRHQDSRSTTLKTKFFQTISKLCLFTFNRFTWCLLSITICSLYIACELRNIISTPFELLWTEFPWHPSKRLILDQTPKQRAPQRVSVSNSVYFGHRSQLLLFPSFPFVRYEFPQAQIFLDRACVGV